MDSATDGCQCVRPASSVTSSANIRPAMLGSFRTSLGTGTRVLGDVKYLKLTAEIRGQWVQFVHFRPALRRIHPINSRTRRRDHCRPVNHSSCRNPHLPTFSHQQSQLGRLSREMVEDDVKPCKGLAEPHIELNPVTMGT